MLLKYIYITFMHLADAFKRLAVHSGYTFFFISMCIPWELNPQPFELLMQCSTTEPQEQVYWICFFYFSFFSTFFNLMYQTK